MKYIAVVILLIGVLFTDVHSQVEIIPTFRFRTTLPIEDNRNFIERTNELQASIRAIWHIGAIEIMAGGTYQQGMVGRRDFTSRSFMTSGLHGGIGVLISQYSGKVKYGLLAQRVMQFMMDTPRGEENITASNIREFYRSVNPLNRYLYYNQVVFGLFVEPNNVFKAELFIKSPFNVPFFSLVPPLRYGKTHESLGFISTEMKLITGTILKMEWNIHSPGGVIKDIRAWDEGTGGITFRQPVATLVPAGNVSLETGWKREIDPTGWYRSDYYFAGFRIVFYARK